VIVLVHLRLRALPRVDQTLVLEGSRDDLTQGGGRHRRGGAYTRALELVSPALARRERWVARGAARGLAALVAGGRGGPPRRHGRPSDAAPQRRGAPLLDPRRRGDRRATRGVRIGGLPDSSDELIDLLQAPGGDEMDRGESGSAPLRWAGETTVDRLRRLRRTLARGSRCR